MAAQENVGVCMHLFIYIYIYIHMRVCVCVDAYIMYLLICLDLFMNAERQKGFLEHARLNGDTGTRGSASGPLTLELRMDLTGKVWDCWT